MKTNDSIPYTPIFRLRTRVFIRVNYIYILFLPEIGIVKPVKFTDDSACLARGELLVISKSSFYLIDLQCLNKKIKFKFKFKLIYIFHFFCFLGHCTVLHCTRWCKLIRTNFEIAF